MTIENSYGCAAPSLPPSFLHSFPSLFPFLIPSPPRGHG